MFQRFFLNKATLKYWSLLSVSFLSPIIISFYLTYLSPRPFYILEDDPDHTNYYSALLLYAGQPVVQIVHPGTPIRYVAYLIMLVSTSDFEAVQHFFDLSYFVVSLLTAASLCTFVWMLLRDVPTGISLLTLASILAW